MTRSARLLAAATALLLAGCGTAPAPAPAVPAGPEDRVVVALDDFAALHAMSLGVQPDLVLEVFGYASTAAVFADAGIATQPYGGALDVEQVLAATPDVVLGVSLPTTLEAEEELRAVAETTVLDYTAPWQEQLTATAAALGVPERATALQQRLDDDLTELATDLTAAGLDGTTASVLGELDGVFSPPAATPAGTVLAEAGLARPAPQQGAVTADSPFVAVSPETLGDHAGEVVYLLTGGPYGQAAGITANPLWPPVQAGARAGVHRVSAETWFGSSAFTVDWIARDLRATLLEGGQPATDTDAPARFRAFTAGRPGPGATSG